MDNDERVCSWVNRSVFLHGTYSTTLILKSGMTYSQFYHEKSVFFSLFGDVANGVYLANQLIK